MTIEIPQNTHPMTQQLGELVLPVMQQIPERMPQMGCAVLCTADGYNVCSLSVEDEDVRKMASICSSLFTMSRGVIHAVTRNQHNTEHYAHNRKELMLTVGNLLVVLTEVRHPTLGNLVLLISTESSFNGLVLVTARYIVKELEELFVRHSLSLSGTTITS